MGAPLARTQALNPDTAPPLNGRRPDWLKVPLSHGPHFKGLKRLMREHGLHTICEEAACPNIGECWGEFKTASFLLLVVILALTVVLVRVMDVGRDA